MKELGMALVSIVVLLNTIDVIKLKKQAKKEAKTVEIHHIYMVEKVNDSEYSTSVKDSELLTMLEEAQRYP